MTQLPDILRVRSYLAPNMAFFYEAVGRYLGRIFKVGIDFDQSPCDALDDPALRSGQIDIAFICGLPLVRLQAQGLPLSVVSAPVLRDQRNQRRPVYFADVIVPRASSYQRLDDLRGTVFCYNDPGSNSGYHLLRHHLLKTGAPDPFFAQAVVTGSHQRSIQRIAAGGADCAAIDSAVLAQALHDEPGLRQRIRLVHAVGPCPVPPLALANPGLLKAKAVLQDALTHPDLTLQAVMVQAGITSLVPVSNAHYTPIYNLFMAAERAHYILTDA